MAVREKPSRPAPPFTIENEHPIAHVKKSHDRAYRYIEEGLVFDQQDYTEEALFLYEKGLKFLDRAIEVRCDGATCTGLDWDQARTSQQKMRRVRMKIKNRIDELKSEILPLRNQKTESSHTSLNLPSAAARYQTTITEIPSSIEDGVLLEDNTPETPETLNAQEIFCLEHGVQLFYISQSGDVGIPSYPTSLKIYQFTEKSLRVTRTALGTLQQVPAFLQVGDWSYPLVKNCSPILRTSYGAYVFPDMTSQESGASVGVLLPAEEISDNQRQEFEQYLQRLTGGMVSYESEESLRHYPSTEEPFSGLPLVPEESSKKELKKAEVREGEKFSSKLSKGLVSGAEWISWGVTKGAEKTYHLVRAGASKLRERLQPEERPLAIDPRTQVGLQIVRDTSGIVVKVSSFLVDKLSMVSMALAKKLAPEIRKQGARLLSEDGNEVDGYQKMDAMMDVAMGGLRGAVIIYNSLEHAAILLARSIAEETVHLVQHKYGDDAGQLADNALSSVGNLAMATHNVRSLGIKAVAKRTAKDTSRVLIEEHATERNRRKLGTKVQENPTNVI